MFNYRAPHKSSKSLYYTGSVPAITYARCEGRVFPLSKWDSSDPHRISSQEEEEEEEKKEKSKPLDNLRQFTSSLREPSERAGEKKKKGTGHWEQSGSSSGPGGTSLSRTQRSLDQAGMWHDVATAWAQ